MKPTTYNLQPTTKCRDGDTIRFVKVADLPIDALANLYQPPEGEFVVQLGNRSDDGTHPVTLKIDAEGNAVALQFADMERMMSQLAADGMRQSESV